MALNVNRSLVTKVVVKDRVSGKETNVSSITCNGKTVWEDYLWLGASDDGIYYSTDGKNWSKHPNQPADYVYCVFYSNGVWLAGAGSGIFYSENGMEWEPTNVTSGRTTNIRTLVVTESTQQSETKTRFFAWYKAYGYVRDFYYSDDGRVWHNISMAESKTNTTISDVCGWYTVNSSRVVCAASSGIYLSEDGGKNFVPTNITSRCDCCEAILGDCVYVGGSAQYPGLYAPTDATGLNWSKVANASSIHYSHIKGLTSVMAPVDATQAKWVATGDGTTTARNVYYRPYTGDWATISYASGTLSFEGGARRSKSLLEQSGIWVGCQSNATSSSVSDVIYGLFYSTDGVNWNQSNISYGSYERGARCDANGFWVACSKDSGLYYSTNGKNWSKCVGTGTRKFYYAWCNKISDAQMMR